MGDGARVDVPVPTKRFFENHYGDPPVVVRRPERREVPGWVSTPSVPVTNVVATMAVRATTPRTDAVGPHLAILHREYRRVPLIVVGVPRGDN